MKILIAEDEVNIANQYKAVLKQKHSVILTYDGEACLKEYYDELENFSMDKGPSPERRKMPFDAVVLDYRMPKKDGMEVAREILAIAPKQRILFASAYVVDTLVESVKTLQQVVELIQKPFDLYEFVDLLEDKNIWTGLEKLNVKVKEVKDLNPSHKEISDLLEGLRKLQKGRTWTTI
jgi:DNA-binding response OmpR family regulator